MFLSEIPTWTDVWIRSRQIESAVLLIRHAGEYQTRKVWGNKKKAASLYVCFPSACKWYAKTQHTVLWKPHSESIKGPQKSVKSSQCWSQTFTRAERTTGRKVMGVSQECSVVCLGIHYRHSATGLHCRITFFLLNFSVRVKGSEKFSWPVTFPVQRKF